MSEENGKGKGKSTNKHKISISPMFSRLHRLGTDVGSRSEGAATAAPSPPPQQRDTHASGSPDSYNEMIGDYEYIEAKETTDAPSSGCKEQG